MKTNSVSVETIASDAGIDRALRSAR
jgi:hypothetical protein